MQKNFFAELKKAFTWPEFGVIWAVLGLAVVALGISAFYVPPVLLFIEAAVFVAVAGILWAGVYRLIRLDRETAIGRNEFRSMLVNLEDGLIVYDKDFKGLFFNPTAEKLFNISAADVIGHEFQPQDVEKPGWKILAQVMFPSIAPMVVSRSPAGRYPQILDISFQEPTLEFRVSTLQVGDGNEPGIGFMKVIHNRTAEVSLMKSRNDFLTIASHQLRTPATEIAWALDSLLGDPSLNSESKKIAQTAKEASQGLTEIVEDLLNVSSIEEGRFGYTFAPADIVDLVATLLERLVSLAQRTGIMIYFDKPKVPVPQPFIDRQKLSLALGNILENAIRYNTERGEVVVRVRKLEDKPFIEVSVTDTGIGISEQDIEDLFKKFFRSRSAARSHTIGSGLGLYIAKNIVQAHGGEIWVESEPTRGSTFHVTLPTEARLIPEQEVATEG